jgi:hypothetical protein
MYFSPLRERLSFEPLLPSASPSLGKNVFLLFSSVYLFCFLAGMNYDHRLTPLIISLLLLNTVFPKNRPSRWFLTVQIGALWATIFFFGVTGPIHVFLAIFGNICQLILAVYLLGAMYRTLESSGSLKWVEPLFHKISAHYIEFTPNMYTALGAGEVVYHADETTACKRKSMLLVCLNNVEGNRENECGKPL